MVKKLVRIDMNNIQTHLLDFVDDIFIRELLHNIMKYMQFTEKKEYIKHAYMKAEEIIKKLNEYFTLLVQTVRASEAKGQSHDLGNDAYKRYKSLAQHEKIACLITQEDLQ